MKILAFGVSVLLAAPSVAAATGGRAVHVHEIAIETVDHAALRPVEEEAAPPAFREEVDSVVNPDDFPGPDDFRSAPANQVLQGRDPFRPFTLDIEPEAQAREEFVTPLQRYELQQLTVVGVVLNLEPPRAMVQDDAGMGFIVTPGTLIGRRQGVVTDIQSRQIIVEETYVDYYGREQVKQVVLNMPSEEEASE